MKEYGTNELFETVRQAPTELSQQQVMEIITVLPTLPPPGSSWFNINLNSIIMTTTVVAIISTAVIWFTNPISPSELPGQEPEQQPTNLTTTQTQNGESKVPIDTIGPIMKLPPLNQSFSDAQQQSPPLSASKSKVTLTEQGETQMTTPIKPAKVTTTPQPSQISKPTSAPSGRAIKHSTHVADNTVEPLAATPAKGSSSIQLKKLKRKLLRELVKDDLIISKRNFNVLFYGTNEIYINSKKLDYENFKKYRTLLREYNVMSGPNKRVALDPKFIMVGDFTDQGFEGSALGQSMNINFISQGGIFREGLFGKPLKVVFLNNPDSQKPQSLLGSNASKETGLLNGEKKDNMMMYTEGKVQDAEENTRSASALTAKGPGEEKLFDDNIYVIGNAVTMTKKGVDEPPVALDSYSINQLKRDLYRYLVKDDLVKSNKADVNMTLGTGPFSINANNPFSTSMQERYAALFRSYGITLRPQLKILMSTDFIFVGEFGEDNFNGSVQGVLVKEKIEGSIFEKELGQYALFSEPNEPEEVATEQRSVQSFDRVRVSGLAVVYYSQGPEKDLRLEVSGMPIEDVITEVKQGELHVYTSPEKTFIGESIKVHVSSPAIKSIFVDDAAEFKGQTQITEETLKVSSFGAGAVELGVDVDRLHLVMDGGDIDVEGKATMERTDFLNDANDGQLDQSGLKVMKNWEPEEKISDSGVDLIRLKANLTDKLLDDGLIVSTREQVTISFSTTAVQVEGVALPDNLLISYLQLFKAYGLSLRNERKLFLSREFIVIADRNNGQFEFEMRGTNLSFSEQDTWEELEDDIFNRRD
ncbi:MAG: hypothetical protein Roseis2KO_27730 [Roseivirga sp.]